VTAWAHWRGMIARAGTDTRDGRRLLLEDFAPAHFVRLPVPVTARPKPVHLSGPLAATSLAPFVVVGRIDRVSVREPKTLQHHGKEIHGEGVLNLDDLFQVRPDLRETKFGVDGDGQGTHTAWPVGIEVKGGEFEGDENAGSVIVSGRWELIAMAIEHSDSVWPGVGIECYQFEDDGRIQAN
jgi:hypothetical protein